jgi:hypothetical protein
MEAQAGFRTTVLARKTHVVLWAFGESVRQPANETKNHELFDSGAGRSLLISI